MNGWNTQGESGSLRKGWASRACWLSSDQKRLPIFVWFRYERIIDGSKDLAARVSKVPYGRAVVDEATVSRGRWGPGEWMFRRQKGLHRKLGMGCLSNKTEMHAGRRNTKLGVVSVPFCWEVPSPDLSFYRLLITGHVFPYGQGAGPHSIRADLKLIAGVSQLYE